MAVSSKDIETLWRRYSDEAVKRGISVTQFFESNGVPYHVFEKWYKKKFTQPEVVNCVVKAPQDVTPQFPKDTKVDTDATTGGDDHGEKNISYVYVGFNDGMKIEHHKLSYNELVSFIKKIQPLCLV
ncbi:MAG: hypothetical protein IJ548_05090 [Paludibacteraceae bacterium]|nr:hypothetical protein [Paludibacteraceae bacterium]